MTAWLAVAVGGAIGSAVRHGVNRWAAAQWPAFPAGTMVVNLVGCFLAGLLAGLLAAKRLQLPVHGREFVFVGLLGGFTTFSAFSLDTFVLAKAQPGYAAMNVVVQVIGGLAAAWVGYRLTTP